ncbi:hypothetical protein Hanom_Chr01g00072481 [Helianthus anomalus]
MSSIFVHIDFVVEYHMNSCFEMDLVDELLDASGVISLFKKLVSGKFQGDMEGVHSYVEGICERNGLVSVVEDDMEGVHSSQFLGKNASGIVLGRPLWVVRDEVGGMSRCDNPHNYRSNHCTKSFRISTHSIPSIGSWCITSSNRTW